MASEPACADATQEYPRQPYARSLSKIYFKEVCVCGQADSEQRMVEATAKEAATAMLKEFRGEYVGRFKELEADAKIISDGWTEKFTSMFARHKQEWRKATRAVWGDIIAAQAAEQLSLEVAGITDKNNFDILRAEKMHALRAGHAAKYQAAFGSAFGVGVEHK